MRRQIRRLLWYGLAIVATVTDLLVKLVAEAELSDGRSVNLGLLSLQLVHNRGVSFGFGATLPAAVILIGTGVIIVAVGAFLWRVTRKPKLLVTAGVSLVLGGAIANFLDRLDGRGVVDYLNISWFATFNLADVFSSAERSLPRSDM